MNVLTLEFFKYEDCCYSQKRELSVQTSQWPLGIKGFKASQHRVTLAYEDKKVWGLQVC